MKNIWLDGMMGVVVGDALGTPVQFCTRAEIKRKPVKTMEGYGTFNMPPGTWSDDSSMALATLVSIREKNDIDYDDIMKRFVDWLYNGAYTPAGMSFDIGNTCMEAIRNYVRKPDYHTCGKEGERANGNGALMRIMPVCLFAYEKIKSGEWTLEEGLEKVHQVSALTHNHLRSKIACGMYYFMVANILDKVSALGGNQERKYSLIECLQAGIDDGMRFYHGDMGNYDQLAYYSRLFYLDKFVNCPEREIKSSGYVVDSLEAALWCLITTNSLEDALLKAVNLGDDTDTVGAIAGGLATLYYGYENIPKEWKESIVRKEWVEEVCGSCMGKLSHPLDYN